MTGNSLTDLVIIFPFQPKEELFWDSAVDAVITDKANVKNPSAKVNSGTSDAEKVNTNGNEKVDYKVVEIKVWKTVLNFRFSNGL